MLYEKLTDKDKDLIQSYIMEFAEGGDYHMYNDPEAPLSRILRFWDANKMDYLYDLFGGKFILEKEIALTRSESELIMQMNRALGKSPMQEFREGVMSRLLQCCEIWSDTYYNICRLFNASTLVSNRITYLSPGTKEVVELSPDRIIRIEPNAKVMKILSKLAKEFNLFDEYERFRIEHSMVLNVKQITGTLCLSIHPLDYLTMSDNDNGWSSCMSWGHDGDYRCGTIEMMNSPCVIVAYIKSADHVLEWHGGEWNSKQWRSLFIVHGDMIASIKGYPYQYKEGVESVLEWLRELSKTNLGLEYGPTRRLYIGERAEYDGKMIRLECFTNRMYNDCGVVDQHGMLRPELENGAMVQINYSGELSCIWCGQLYDPYEDNIVACDSCCDCEGERCYCEECGEQLYEDDVYWVDGSPLCEYCFDKLAIEDTIFGSYIFKDDSIKVVLAEEADLPNVEDDFIYTHEYRALREANYQPNHWLSDYAKCPPHKIKDTYNAYYWNYEDLTETGLRHLFGIFRPSN